MLPFQEAETQDQGEFNDDESLEVEDDSSIITSVSENPRKFTSQPTRTQPKKTKRQKQEEFENELLTKSVHCMEKVANEQLLDVVRKDEYDVFGQHVANELRQVEDKGAQRYAKVQIQRILYQAQTDAA